MLLNNRGLIIYGLSDIEKQSLKGLELNYRVVKEDMLSMKIKDIIEGLQISIYDENIPKEKIILFNNYSDNELKETINLVRTVVEDGILAVVTPVSENWTFGYLIEHLIEERKWVLENQKGR